MADDSKQSPSLSSATSGETKKRKRKRNRLKKPSDSQKHRNDRTFYVLLNQLCLCQRRSESSENSHEISLSGEKKWRPNRFLWGWDRPENQWLKELPQKFVRLYGESLSNSVVLKPPFGSTWKIGLEKRDGKVRLQQGWPEFAKHYALGFGHLLFFRYKGNSQFQLSICDITTCEISSPSIPAHLDECDVNESKKEETEGDCDAVQVFDSSSSGEEDLPPSSPHHKRVRASASGQGIKTASGDKFATRRGRKPKVHTKTRSQTPTGEDKTLGSDSSNNDSGIHPLGQAEETKSQNPQGKSTKFKSGDHRAIGRLTLLRFRESKAYEAANKFFSKKPFCITIVTSTYAARLPSAFARRLEQKAQTIRLEVGNSSWPVQFTNCNSGSFLSGGYSRFRTENSLHRGDVCIFELNKRKDQREVVFKVYIFRNNML